MHITISPTGEIHMDTNGSTPAEIAGTVLSIQREIRKQQEEQEQARAEADRAPAIPVSLNDIQGVTYDWLVRNDNPAGVHRTACATAFRISSEAAGARLSRLVEEGFATRTGSGKYRPVTE